MRPMRRQYLSIWRERAMRQNAEVYLYGQVLGTHLMRSEE